MQWGGGHSAGGALECPGLLPTQWEPVSPHRCDENCLSCEGSSRNCSRCKSGFTQLGTSCVTNHTCSNGEPSGWRPGCLWGPAGLWLGRKGEEGMEVAALDAGPGCRPGAPTPQASDADHGHSPPPAQPLRLGLWRDSQKRVCSRAVPTAVREPRRPGRGDFAGEARPWGSVGTQLGLACPTSWTQRTPSSVREAGSPGSREIGTQHQRPTWGFQLGRAGVGAMADMLRREGASVAQQDTEGRSGLALGTASSGVAGHRAGAGPAKHEATEKALGRPAGLGVRLFFGLQNGVLSKVRRLHL